MRSRLTAVAAVAAVAMGGGLLTGAKSCSGVHAAAVAPAGAGGGSVLVKDSGQGQHWVPWAGLAAAAAGAGGKIVLSMARNQGYQPGDSELPVGKRRGATGKVEADVVGKRLTDNTAGNFSDYCSPQDDDREHVVVKWKVAGVDLRFTCGSWRRMGSHLLWKMFDCLTRIFVAVGPGRVQYDGIFGGKVRLWQIGAGERGELVALEDGELWQLRLPAIRGGLPMDIKQCATGEGNIGE